MSTVKVIQHGNGWSVWIALDGHDPMTEPFGFVVGYGDTRDEAVTDAVADLEDVIETLQSGGGEPEA